MREARISSMLDHQIGLCWEAGRHRGVNEPPNPVANRHVGKPHDGLLKPRKSDMMSTSSTQSHWETSKEDLRGIHAMGASTDSL
jgi:hypothetical protein